MSNELMNEEEMIYTVLQVKYVKTMGREVSIDPIVNQDLYPYDWCSIGNLIKKSNILIEAIEKKCLIVETEGYTEIQEGVKNTRNKGVDRCWR